MECYEAEKYVCTKETLKETLSKYGVAVVHGVLDATETASMNEGAWRHIEQITAGTPSEIKQDDPTTWRRFWDLFPMHSMLMQHWGIGHAQYLWNIRQNPKVVDMFTTLWGVEAEDLLCSFDGASFHFPPEDTGRGFNRGNLWLHTDQSYMRNGFECIQSWVTGRDVNRGDATLAILEGSHVHHKEAAKKFRATKQPDDWYKLSDKEKAFYQEKKGCELKYIQCPAGSMVFWDSRTIHCGVESFRGRLAKNFRNVGYVCMMPRKGVDGKVIKKKQKAFEDRRATSHWANKVTLFQKSPRTYGRAIPTLNPVPEPQLTALGKKLAGF